MGVDDCTEVTHTVSALLDVADPIEHTYLLEGELARDRPPSGSARGL